MASPPAEETGSITAIVPADVGQVARLHLAVLPDGFLARLGERLLAEIYAGAISAPGTIGLAAREEHGIGGFVLATTDTRALFHHVLRRRGLAMVQVLLRTVVRDPRVLLRILESVRYPEKRGLHDSGECGDAELMAFGVLPEHRSRGYAGRLVLALNDEFARRGVSAYTASVYASNLQATRFYARMGFERLREFQMYDRPWALYRLRLPCAAGAADPRWQEAADRLDRSQRRVNV